MRVPTTMYVSMFAFVKLKEFAHIFPEEAPQGDPHVLSLVHTGLPLRGVILEPAQVVRVGSGGIA
eukprot:CAMPEP_0115108218 /NCGR_PEP_ID=MMETSP0227-20121206/37849_1 /TAXON_ID=89957 /ORGANISM="Polarella glacialis, Strain CCMP 1383" /LENGTH=64 /DNA_ID=CAMNT_0002506423 /DNA_START=393 /DNA_END=583 /DNA_ORIENTATION=-